MAVSSIDSKAILLYAEHLSAIQAAGMSNSQDLAACASFVRLLIEYATDKILIGANLLLNLRLPSHDVNVLKDYNAFLSVPSGSILGICRMRTMEVVHYVVKLKNNSVIGINAGGILRNRANRGDGLRARLFVYDFNNSYFIYDNNTNDKYRLYELEYTLYYPFTSYHHA